MPKQILIAPSWGSGGIIESGLGKNLVDQLLELGHKVILRPHPQTIKLAKDKIEKIKDRNKNNPNFTFEDSVDGDESLFLSDIIISDWSGVAIEYTFALKKPVIFCKVSRKINNPNYQDIKIEPIEISIRDKIGVIWDGNSPINELIEISLQKKKIELDNIRDNYCYNIGSSDELFYEILVNKFQKFKNK